MDDGLDTFSEPSHENCVNADGVSAYQRGGGQQLSRGIVAERRLLGCSIVTWACDFFAASSRWPRFGREPWTSATKSEKSKVVKLMRR